MRLYWISMIFSSLFSAFFSRFRRFVDMLTDGRMDGHTDSKSNGEDIDSRLSAAGFKRRFLFSHPMKARTDIVRRESVQIKVVFLSLSRAKVDPMHCGPE